MIKIERCAKTEDTVVYPMDIDDICNDYGTAANFVSALSTYAIIGSQTYQLGDSGIYVHLSPTGKLWGEGVNEFREMAQEFFQIVKIAIPEMTEPYKSIYEFFLEDYQTNGIIMPLYGRII